MTWKPAALLCLFAWPWAVDASELEEILRRQEAAVGGAERWSQINTVRIILDIREPAFEVSAVYLASREGSMRIDVFADGHRVFAEGLNNDQAWEWRPDSGRVEVDAEAAAALRHGIEKPGRFHTMAQLPATGASLKLIDASETASANEWQIRVTLKDGFVVDYFVHKQTRLITRSRDVRAFHPTIDPEATMIETRYLEHQWVDGLLRNTVSDTIDVVSGDWLATSTVREIQHNLPVKTAFFRGSDLP